MKTMNFIFAALVTASFSFVGCKKETEKSNVTYGKEVKFGNGTAKAFVKLDEMGNPEEVGAALSESALTNLPHEMTAVLDIPTEASKTNFKHVLLDYLHTGHEPANVYTVPHFDVHFYKTTSAERETITATDPRFAKDPAEGFLPAGYIKAGPVPQMGMHWADPTGSEFMGKPFTSTLIYGSLADKITFIEPMIALDFLKQTSHSHFPIKQPTKFGESGLFPSEYCIRFNADAKQYEITLETFSSK